LKNIILLTCSIIIVGCSTSKSWQTASRESVGIAPKPEDHPEAIYQIYTARAFAWRSFFGVHPWISWKEPSAASYTVAQVTSWGLRRNGSTVSVMQDLPDRKWYDHEPTIIFEARGEKAEILIQSTKKLIETYPYKDRYSVWPGPNSNTFVDYIIRNVPELTVELPPEAIGKDYLVDNDFFSKSPGGYGYQFSAYGLLGLTLGLTEGVEVNLLGMTFGIDFYSPALKIPFWGRLGFKDQPWSSF
jgi:hypothetical protein